ncbi:hypothetical protein M899_2822 [Bacteriovorax sp. BSW11_IV]|uniref:hypothetical protein n=1 Tax=Bacteriovorax sp. BSW11_IV TaxID=1353529 RepID=UPI000389E9D3|nr:hypothetical protein [Bacteriovorax sp. BSW11_IV]EQC50208.1 hypothetical protein M899_2822 [Bacteriovorax sp. BSW11_IV]
MKNDHQLSVALLMSDLTAAREISRVFKQAGVVPYFYDTLRDYWNGIVNDVPSLSVVDVKMMSDGDLFLATHPFVRTEALPLVFYYTDESAYLTGPAFECFNLGMIKNELGFDGQIKSLLKRVNHFYRLDRENSNLRTQAIDVDSKVGRVVEANQKLQEKTFYGELFSSITEDFESARSNETFAAALSEVFTKYEEIEKYSCFEMSANGKKLIGLEGEGKKYFQIPALWLGKNCQDGIEPFAQNLASQVAFDLMGENLICLNIKGVKKHPEMLLFVQCNDEEMLNHFNWDLLERYLSGLCEHYKLKASPKHISTDIFMSPWDVMSLLDSKAMGKVPGDHYLPNEITKESVALINLDFTTLVDYVRSTKGSRFYWKEFFKDFVARIDHLEIDSLKVTSMGVEHVGLLVPEYVCEDAFRLIKGLIGRYPFWRFFEDSDLVLAQSLRPEVRMSPISSEGYFQVMEGLHFAAADLINQEEKQEITRKLIWGDAPDQTV